MNEPWSEPRIGLIYRSRGSFLAHAYDPEDPDAHPFAVRRVAADYANTPGPQLSLHVSDAYGLAVQEHTGHTQLCIVPLLRDASLNAEPIELAHAPPVQYNANTYRAVHAQHWDGDYYDDYGAMLGSPELVEDQHVAQLPGALTLQEGTHQFEATFDIEVRAFHRNLQERGTTDAPHPFTWASTPPIAEVSELLTTEHVRCTNTFTVRASPDDALNTTHGVRFRVRRHDDQTLDGGITVRTYRNPDGSARNQTLSLTLEIADPPANLCIAVFSAEITIADQRFTIRANGGLADRFPLDGNTLRISGHINRAELPQADTASVTLTPDPHATTQRFSMFTDTAPYLADTVHLPGLPIRWIEHDPSRRP